MTTGRVASSGQAHRDSSSRRSAGPSQWGGVDPKPPAAMLLHDTLGGGLRLALCTGRIKPSPTMRLGYGRV
jgi:hypothetical protein